MAEAMKDSKTRWLGQIPVDWDMARVKDCFDRKNKKANQKDPVVLSLARSGVKIRDISSNEGQLAADYTNYNPVAKDDILINPMDLVSGDNCNISRVEGVISPAYVNLRYKKGINPRFYNYYFKLQYWLGAFFAHGFGVSFDNRWTLSYETLSKYPLVLPPSDEQDKIADFLDEKCAEIDQLSEDIQNQIDILEEYKKSVITRAVTKGLNPNVKMKDSGAQWIGDIPSDWTTIPVKYCFTIENGSDPKTEDGDTPVYGSGSKSFKTCVEFKKGPTVLLGRKGTVNTPQYVEGKYWNVDTAFNTKTKGGYDLKLFYYAAQCFDYENYSTQTALPSMTQHDYYNFRLPLMPEEEQTTIVAFLDKKCNEIIESINMKRSQLQQLDIYKKSIIYEYVTGKKRVA
ncbi:restriction endonuclease subunit S [Candidatus Saccharibacteria bacterium]|nr:restriction endonuclease subunit S [Candidatus Saccharibacteria bacterium]